VAQRALASLNLWRRGTCRVRHVGTLLEGKRVGWGGGGTEEVVGSGSANYGQTSCGDGGPILVPVPRSRNHNQGLACLVIK
jgi:hypothetical protein